MLTDHDEFLHMGYPRNDSTPWKENYYFNFYDFEQGSLGIIHSSIRRDKGVVTVRAHVIQDGEQFNYTNTIPWPPQAEALPDSTVISDGTLSVEIVNPFAEHRVMFNNEDLNMDLRFTKRFEAFNYHDASEGQSETEDDKALSVEHYEQGMVVAGTVAINGKTVSIDCLGQRDHTWGFRDERNLLGWNWVAVQAEASTLSFSKVRRKDDTSLVAGYISTPAGNQAVTAVDVVDISRNTENEPLDVHYRVTLADDSVLNIKASRATKMLLGNPGSRVIHHENFSKFMIEETGEAGLGVDEHMEILPKNPKA